MMLNRERIGFLAAGAVIGAAATELLRRAWSRRRPKAGALAPPESTIRLMTRLALKHGAVNLSQGFPNEPPPREMSLAAAGALIDGRSLDTATAAAARLSASASGGAAAPEKDLLSQYSFPFGLPLLRARLQEYYREFYPALRADAEANLTVCLGATEGFAVCLRALCAPGDAVAFFQPFHELYPAQCALWGLTPRAVTLRETAANGWRFDEAELDAALAGDARVLLLNSPHNPTGKVFSRAELATIARICARRDVMVVTDEIYEHIVFDGEEHVCIASLDGMAERTFVVSALSKTARATGWRVGWVVSPAAHTPTVRACHDQLVLQAATPLQFGAAACLALGRAYFEGVAAEYLPKRELLLRALRKAGFEILAPPRGAYYVFAGYRRVPELRALSPKDAAMRMTEHFKVACVPGDNFYLGSARTDRTLGGNYLRFTFVRSLDVLAEAAQKLEALAPQQA